METGKIEKFDLSNIRVNNRSRDELSTKLLNLNVGEGFTVTGMEQANVSTRAGAIAREAGDGRKFATHRLGIGKHQVIRVK